jgi:hypothetical protein
LFSRKLKEKIKFHQENNPLTLFPASDTQFINENHFLEYLGLKSTSKGRALEKKLK